MEFISVIALFTAAMLGGLAAWWFRSYNPKLLSIVLSFSGAFIFALTISHLLPDVYASGGPYTGIFVLLGFMIQSLLDHLSKGVEHGHIHVEQADMQRPLSFAVSILFGLSLHAFLEGMPISAWASEQFSSLLHAHHDHGHEGHDEHGHINLGHQLLMGVLIHKIPEAFALVMVMIATGLKRPLIIGSLIIFACMSPLGLLTTKVLGRSGLFVDTRALLWLIAMVVGSFLHISTTIIFEAGDKHHSFKWGKFLAVLIGFTAAILINMATGH
jgi:zinc transporter ZupT